MSYIFRAGVDEVCRLLVGWKTPPAEPVRVQRQNPFTGSPYTQELYDPGGPWDDAVSVDPATIFKRRSLAETYSYELGKELTDLAVALGVAPTNSRFLVGPDGMLFRLEDDILRAIASSGEGDAERWPSAFAFLGKKLTAFAKEALRRKEAIFVLLVEGFESEVPSLFE